MPATNDQLQAFRDALNRWSALQAGPSDNVDRMVGSVELAIVGVLGPSGPGRKAYGGPGIFDSYANLVVRDVQVLKGTLPDSSADAHVEVPWPNNLNVDELVNATPVGARVIVLGDRVKGALEAAQTLQREEGIDSIADVEVNLLTLPPYGLLVEGVDGRTHVPLWEGGPLLLSEADVLTNFEDALNAIRAAAKR